MGDRASAAAGQLSRRCGSGAARTGTDHGAYGMAWRGGRSAACTCGYAAGDCDSTLPCEERSGTRSALAADLGRHAMRHERPYAGLKVIDLSQGRSFLVNSNAAPRTRGWRCLRQRSAARPLPEPSPLRPVVAAMHQSIRNRLGRNSSGPPPLRDRISHPAAAIKVAVGAAIAPTSYPRRERDWRTEMLIGRSVLMCISLRGEPAHVDVRIVGGVGFRQTRSDLEHQGPTQRAVL